MEKNEYFVITPDIMRNATTYMPLFVKHEVATTIAKLIVDDMPLAPQNKSAEELISLPYMRQEDTRLKSIHLLNQLLTFYLNIDIENENLAERFDYYAGGHILNQLERFKADMELKNKAFDLLTDYKELKKMVDTEIFNLKANANDPMARFTAIMQLMSKPENVKTLIAALKDTIEKKEENK